MEARVLEHDQTGEGEPPFVQARIVELAGGHASVLESPDAFLAALDEHVAGN